MLSCFQKVDLGDMIRLGENDEAYKDYMAITPFDGYKVKTVNMQTYRMDDICVSDIPYMRRIIKSNPRLK